MTTTEGRGAAVTEKTERKLVLVLGRMAMDVDLSHDGDMRTHMDQHR